MSNFCASVVGRPSTALAASSAAAERSRVTAQVAALGPEGLAAKGEALRAAAAANDAPFPPSAMDAFPVPPVDGISLHSIATLRSSAVAAVDGEAPCPPPPGELVALRDELSSFPLPAQFDHVRTAFVDCSLLLRTDGLDEAQRQLLPLFCSLLFEARVFSPQLHQSHLHFPLDHCSLILSLFRSRLCAALAAS